MQGDDETVASTAGFFIRGAVTYLLRLPCLCNAEVLMDGHKLAKVAREMKKG